MRNKFFDFLNIVGTSFFIVLLLVVLVNSLEYWSINFTIQQINEVSFESKMYSLAIIIVIVTVFGEWLNGRIKSLINSINNLMGGKNDKGRKKVRTINNTN